jgi:hypothetical protein
VPHDAALVVELEFELEAGTGDEATALVPSLEDVEAPPEPPPEDPPPEASPDEDAPEAGAPPSAAAGAGAFEPPLKSVAYQPEPLSWKPAAVSCLVKVAAWQAGQSVSKSSEIFCKTSLAWPQALHL